MNCRDSKVAIALHLGNDDADPASWEAARRHAATCQECRQHYKSLKRSMAVLEQSDVEETYEVNNSLWPEVETRLKALATIEKEPQWKSWGPYIPLTVACLLFLMVWINPPQESPSSHSQHKAGRGMSNPFASVIEHSRSVPHPDKASTDRDQSAEKPDNQPDTM